MRVMDCGSGIPQPRHAWPRPSHMRKPLPVNASAGRGFRLRFGSRSSEPSTVVLLPGQIGSLLALSFRIRGRNSASTAVQYLLYLLAEDSPPALVVVHQCC